MPETYIPLAEAAQYEGIPYNTLVQRLRRENEYHTRTLPRERGGRAQVEIAVSSLTAKGRKAYRAAQRIELETVDMGADAAPWYVDADLNWYVTNYGDAYRRAVTLAGKVQEYLECSDGAERTSYAAEMAAELGISLRTLYRHAEAVTEANAWAARQEQATGCSYDYYRILALCRKPKERYTFPSLPPAQRALVENIWFDPEFAKNRQTVENLYSKFCEEAPKHGWDEWPSVKTMSRYIQYLNDKQGAESVHYLAAHGDKEWKNRRMIKAKRDTRYLQVMEVVQADAHTFDCWVSVRQDNGKLKAVRPVLVAFIDVRSRRVLGDVMCVTSNMQTIKQATVKMIYQDAEGVPKYLMIDNGKDFTGRDMTGQDRENRLLHEIMSDAEYEGFYRGMGVERWHRSKPYQPWDKAYIERFFGTVCGRFAKWMGSYTGTLTGSKTEAKVNKDIDKLLARGELLSMEEFFAQWSRWKTNVYERKAHRGLKDRGETYTAPGELFSRGERYYKAPPAREVAMVLLMRSDTARVTNQGIRRWHTLYTAYELAAYIDKTVSIKWDVNDVSVLHVYDQDGAKICEARSAELLKFEPELCQGALERHIRNQRRQLHETRDALQAYTTPYELRDPDEAQTPAVVGALDLTIHGKKQKAIPLPRDKEAKGEIRARRKATEAAGDYFAAKGREALKHMQDIG